MRIMSFHGGVVSSIEEEQHLFLVPVVCDDVVGAVGGGYC